MAEQEAEVWSDDNQSGSLAWARGTSLNIEGGSESIEESLELGKCRAKEVLLKG